MGGRAFDLRPAPRALVHPGFLAGRWYSALPGHRLGAGVALNASRSYWVRFFLPQRIEISDLGARVITAHAGGLFGVGLYADDPETARPLIGSLPICAVTGLSTANANTAVSAALAEPVVLERGWLWGAGMADNATATFTIMTAAGSNFPDMVGDATLSNVATAPASQVTGYQDTTGTVNYATGFVAPPDEAIGSGFNVVSGANIAPFFKVSAVP